MHVGPNESIMVFTLMASAICSVIAGSTGTVIIRILILTIGLLHPHVTVLCCHLRIF